MHADPGSTELPFTAADWSQIRSLAKLLEDFIITSREGTAVLKAANEATNRRVDEAFAEIKNAKDEFAKSDGRVWRIIWGGAGFGAAFWLIFWLLDLAGKIKAVVPLK